MLRKFSVPYNNLDPYTYLEAIEKYDPFIDHLYFGLPELGCNYHDRANFIHNFQYKKDPNICTYEFLKLTRNKYKRFLTINNAASFKSNNDRFHALDVVLHLVDEYGLEGVIITDLLLTKYLHAKRPEVEICTSCNSWLWENVVWISGQMLVLLCLIHHVMQ